MRLSNSRLVSQMRAWREKLTRSRRCCASIRYSALGSKAYAARLKLNSASSPRSRGILRAQSANTRVCDLLTRPRLQEKRYLLRRAVQLTNPHLSPLHPPCTHRSHLPGRRKSSARLGRLVVRTTHRHRRQVLFNLECLIFVASCQRAFILADTHRAKALIMAVAHPSPQLQPRQLALRHMPRTPASRQPRDRVQELQTKTITRQNTCGLALIGTRRALYTWIDGGL
mmetsp:Transcript_35562/g.55265  ORF Transcript_35562/g.55265 Transcript_35562/m.55265 type:complete len:227 (+) Transcript_35562:34-714(+)